ncbi:MAG: tetratricopeptide repeat protein [Acidobacteria bacterium]|nr:tetratricopeptide repeat protein [Acidobacteriota bacterium]
MVCTNVSAQNELPEISTPINLDEALQEPLPTDMAASYYYFALAKLNEGQGNLAEALSLMKKALNFNRESTTVHLEMATLLEKNRNLREAIEYARKASLLDPEDPEPHWVLANIYFRMRNVMAPDEDGLQKAVRELEKCRELNPQDERVYYALGGAYFELNRPEEAIRAYEEFQKIYKGTDSGYREIGKYYLGKNNHEKAIEYLKKAIEIQPESVESLYLLGDVYTQLRRIREAIPVYRTLAGIARNNLNVKKQLAFFLIETGDFEEAVDLLNPIVQEDPENFECMLLLGQAQIGMQEYTKAIDTLQSIRAKNPDFNLNAHFYLGVAYKNNGDHAKAIEIFRDLLDKIPPGSKADQDYRLPIQHQLALNYLETGEYGKSIELYREMVPRDPRLNLELMNAYRLNREFDAALEIGKQEYEKNPDNLRIGILYARALADAGKTDGGAEVLNGLMESDPSNIDLYIHLCQIYMQGKRYSEAEEAIQRARRTVPEGEETEKQLEFQLAVVYEIQKDYDRAESLLKEILEADPDNTEAKYRLAAVYERKKDYDRAESLFKEVIRANPGNAGALNYFGYMLADRGIRLEEAVRYVQEALAIDPDNGAYLDSLGWAYFKLNDFENAEKYLLQADRYVKDDPVIYDHLGDFYYKTGDLKKARDYWNQSIQIGTEPEEIRKIRRKLDMLQQREQAE